MSVPSFRLAPGRTFQHKNTSLPTATTHDKASHIIWHLDATGHPDHFTWGPIPAHGLFLLGLSADGSRNGLSFKAVKSLESSAVLGGSHRCEALEPQTGSVMRRATNQQESPCSNLRKER